jgi:hypothetical protein
MGWTYRGCDVRGTDIADILESTLCATRDRLLLDDTHLVGSLDGCQEPSRLCGRLLGWTRTAITLQLLRANSLVQDGQLIRGQRLAAYIRL